MIIKMILTTGLLALGFNNIANASTWNNCKVISAKPTSLSIMIIKVLNTSNNSEVTFCYKVDSTSANHSVNDLKKYLSIANQAISEDKNINIDWDSSSTKSPFLNFNSIEIAN